MRTELQVAHSVTSRDRTNGKTYVVRIVRTSDPEWRPPLRWSSWRDWELPISRVVRRFRHDRRWSVEVLANDQPDTAYRDWRRARPVAVIEGRAEAFEKAIQIARAIEAGEGPY